MHAKDLHRHIRVRHLAASSAGETANMAVKRSATPMGVKGETGSAKKKQNTGRGAGAKKSAGKNDVAQSQTSFKSTPTSLTINNSIR